jgi:hypothetical protein
MENEKVISGFYPEGIFKKVSIQFRNPDLVFEHFYKKTNCWDCTLCEFKSKCDYKILDKYGLSARCIAIRAKELLLKKKC